MRNVGGRKTESSFICGARGSGEIPVLLLLFISREFHVLPTHCRSALYLAGRRGCDVPLPSWSHLGVTLPDGRASSDMLQQSCSLQSCHGLYVTGCLWISSGQGGYSHGDSAWACRSCPMSWRC